MSIQGCDFVQDDTGADTCIDIVRETPGPDGCEDTVDGCCGTHVNEGFGCCPSDPALSSTGADGFGCPGYVPSTQPRTTLVTEASTGPGGPSPDTSSTATNPTTPTTSLGGGGSGSTTSATTSNPTAPVVDATTGEPTQATHGNAFVVSFNGDFLGFSNEQVIGLALLRMAVPTAVITQCGPTLSHERAVHQGSFKWHPPPLCLC